MNIDNSYIVRAQRNFANTLMTLHNTNKTDEITDFGLLMLMTGTIMGDLDMVSTAMENYPENADPTRPLPHNILRILSQLKFIDLENPQQTPTSPRSISEINISNGN